MSKETYEGTASEVWNSWSIRQRDHFSKDHKSEFEKGFSLYTLLNKDFDELPESVKTAVSKHVATGIYERGATVKGQKHVSVTTGNRLPKGYEAIKGEDKNKVYSKGHPKVKVDAGWRLPHGYETTEGAYIMKYAKGATVKTKGDVGKSGKQYGYTLKQYEESKKKEGLFVSPDEYWKKQKGSTYRDFIDRQQSIGEKDKERVMEGYAYKIMIAIDLGSKLVPLASKKFAEKIWTLEEFSDVGKFELGGGVEDSKHTYMMLSRLQMDNEYYLGFGNRSEKSLWAGSVDGQIEEMKKLWNSLPKNGKPEWLSMDDILKYEREMKEQYAEGGGIESESNWEGIDADLQISLEEYIFVATVNENCTEEGEHFVIYKIDGDNFSYGYITESTLDNLIKGKEWASEKDVESFLETCDLSKEDWLKSSFVTKLSEIISYWGIENIMGTSYDANSREWAYEHIGLDIDTYEGGEQYKRGATVKGQKHVSVTTGHRLPKGYEAVKGDDKNKVYSKGHPKVRVDAGWRLPHGYETTEGAYIQKYAEGATIEDHEANWVSDCMKKHSKEECFAIILKDSQFNRYNGKPQNEYTHNRLPKKAVVGKDSVYLSTYTPNTKRHLDTIEFKDPTELLKYLNKNEILAKGATIESLEKKRDVFEKGTAPWQKANNAILALQKSKQTSIKDRTKTLQELIKEDNLSDEQRESLFAMLSKGLRSESKLRSLKSVTKYGLSKFQDAWFTKRFFFEGDKLTYTAGQSYTDEMRTIAQELTTVK